MSVTPVSPSSSSTNPYAAVRTDFKQLTDAIQNGDLSSAQSAYQAIQQSGVTPPPNSPMAKDLAAIGQALQTGDVSTAQQALTTLQTDLQNGKTKGHHGHHHHGGSSNSSSTSTDPTAPQSSTTTDPFTLTGSTVQFTA